MTRHENQRRTLLAALGAGAVTVPFTALAQQPSAPAGAAGKIWRIGVLALGSRATSVPFAAAFVQGLRELGYMSRAAIWSSNGATPMATWRACPASLRNWCS